MSRNQDSFDIRGKPLSSVYWEGYYAFSGGIIVELSEPEQDVCLVTGYSLTDGKEVFRYDFTIGADTQIDDCFRDLRNNKGISYRTRVSGAVDTPDRHASVEEALQSRDPFSLASINELTKRILSAGIKTLGGPMGSRDLFEREYEGFYLMSDGSVLRCRDLCQWDPSIGIVDGAAGCSFHRVDSLANPPYDWMTVGYLRGETFSDLADRFVDAHGRPLCELGLEGSEDCSLLLSAVSGDLSACEVLRHRIRGMLNRQGSRLTRTYCRRTARSGDSTASSASGHPICRC